jgi:hypothetical protein
MTVRSSSAQSSIIFILTSMPNWVAEASSLGGKLFAEMAQEAWLNYQGYHD